MLTNAWLFPGQGSQYTQMGRHLWRHRIASDVLALAESISGLPLRAVMEQGPDPLLRRANFLEPCIVALQASYVLLLQSMGKRPDAVAGYSLGEIGALYCAGSLSLVDALTVASERGKILARDAEKGDWLSRALHLRNPPLALPENREGRVFVGAYNSPRDWTLTGEAADIMAIESSLLEQGGVLSPVAIDGPWHTPLAAESAREIGSLLRSVELREPQTPVCLGTSGVFERDIETVRRSLSRQIEAPVYWTDALGALWQAGVRSTLEIGPGRVLTSFVRANWLERQFHSQFLERQGGRAVDFGMLAVSEANALQATVHEEKSWTQSA